jgi:starvation-inducible DNA-binding protein
MVKKNNEKTIDLLSNFVADSFVLYVKTLNYHWNMVGDKFFMFHRLLEEQYKEMAQGIDDLSERIRMLGGKAPATLKSFLELTTLKEGSSSSSQEKMVTELAADNQKLVDICHGLISHADEIKDQGSSDLLIERLRAHDKNAWILRMHLSKK